MDADATLTRTRFVALVEQQRRLPPQGVWQGLLTDSFVVVANAGSVAAQEAVRRLLGVLGVTELPAATFFLDHALPHVPHLSAKGRRACIVHILDNFEALTEAHPQLKLAMATTPFMEADQGVATGTAEGGSRVLRCARQLHDPTNQELVSLVRGVGGYFPCAEDVEQLCTPARLRVLRLLGLRSTVLPSALLACARSVTALCVRHHASTDGSRGTPGQVARGQGDATTPAQGLARANALLRYLDAHAETMFSATERASWAVSTNNAAPQPSEDEFVSQLLTIPWLPVKQQHDDDLLPLPAEEAPSAAAKSGAVGAAAPGSKRCPLVAPPHRARPVQMQWLCSASYQLVEHAVASDTVRGWFGWDKPITSVVLATQIAALSKVAAAQHPPARQPADPNAQRGASQQSAQPAANRHVTSYTTTTRPPLVPSLPVRTAGRMSMEVPKLYTELGKRLRSEVERASTTVVDQPRAQARLDRFVAQVSAVLKDQAWVWVGDRFVPTSLVAFDAPPHLEPYLFTVPREFQEHRDLLTKFGVPQRFGAVDYGT